MYRTVGMKRYKLLIVADFYEYRRQRWKVVELKKQAAKEWRRKSAYCDGR